MCVARAQTRPVKLKFRKKKYERSLNIHFNLRSFIIYTQIGMTKCDVIALIY